MNRRMIPWPSWLTGLLTVVALSHSATAASSISSKYDGVYSGAASPTPDMSAPSCVTFPLERVVILKGILHSRKAPDQPVITGLITEEGYVSGAMTRPGGKRYAMEGRLDGDTIVAGVIDEAANCDWIVSLARQP